MITIKFHADMYLFAPNNQSQIYLPFSQPKRLKEILLNIGLTGEEIGFIILNGNLLNLNKGIDYLIQDNDLIEIYPFIAGG